MENQTILITDLTIDGKGVGRLRDGKVVFCPGAIPGDRVEISPTSSTPSRFFEVALASRLESVSSHFRLIQPSPERVEHPCPHHSQGCPASPLGVWNYPSALNWKQQQLAETLRRIGGLTDLKIDAIMASSQNWAYRNRIELTLRPKAGAWKMGYQAKGILYPVKCCLLAMESIRKASSILSESLPLVSSDSLVSKLDEMRLLLHDNGAQSCIGVLFITKRTANLEPWLKWLEQSSLKGWEIRLTTAWGTRFQKSQVLASGGDVLIHHWINGFKVQSSATAFSQTNAPAAQTLLQIVGGLIDKGAYLGDFYGGWGAFAIDNALKGGRGLVLESSPDAVEAGRRAAVEANLPITYLQTDLNKVSSLHSITSQLDAVVLDPPRQGLSEAVVQWLNSLGPRRLIYVSCHPAALARDILKLTAYQPSRFIPIDMFPQTPDVETVALLERIRD